MAAYCDDGRFAVSRTGPWGPLDHYQPWDPKRVGFAAPQIGPLDLRQKYGFTRPVINASQYAQYTDPPSSGGYGYSPANLIVTIHYSNPAATVDGCPNVVDFYADEPYTNGGWGMQDIINVADYVHTRGKKFGVGEQGTLLMIPSTARTYFNEHVVSHLDFVTYTNYQNLYSGSGDNDQRPTWTTLRNNYGAKFDRVWISSVKDGFEYSSLGDEYSNLLGHASNLGINIALFYCGPGATTKVQAHKGSWIPSVALPGLTVGFESSSRRLSNIGAAKPKFTILIPVIYTIP